MARYNAIYRNPQTGRVRLQWCNAPTYLHACQRLPRWIYPDGLKMRRQGSPQIYKGM